jgi:hypothetical protein
VKVTIKDIEDEEMPEDKPKQRDEEAPLDEQKKPE